MGANQQTGEILPAEAGCLTATQAPDPAVEITMQILAISGSLRAASSNTAVLQAAAQLAPSGVQIRLYGGLSALPFFNFDLMGDEPEAVRDFRAQVGAADGLLISSPEYGHGVPGVLKNALDWLFTGEEFIGKPVALFNASATSVYAHAQLRETIKVMSACFVEAASVLVPLPGNRVDHAAILANPQIATVLREALTVFVHEIERLGAARNQ